MGLPEGRLFEQALFLYLNIAWERRGVNKENVHVIPIEATVPVEPVNTLQKLKQTKIELKQYNFRLETMQKYG